MMIPLDFVDLYGFDDATQQFPMTSYGYGVVGRLSGDSDRLCDVGLYEFLMTLRENYDG